MKLLQHLKLKELRKNRLLTKQTKKPHINISLQRLDQRNYHFAFIDHLPGEEKLQIDIQREKYGSCLISIQLGDFKQNIEIGHGPTEDEKCFFNMQRSPSCLPDHRFQFLILQFRIAE